MSSATPDTRAGESGDRAGWAPGAATRGLDCPPRALRRQHVNGGAAVFAGAAVFGLALLAADAVTQGVALAIAAVLP